MSEHNHTPVPWAARPRHGYPDRDEYCGLGWEIDGPPEAQLRGQFAKAADAYKAAAAPEMLDALESVGMDDHIDLSEGVVMVSIRTMRVIHAAIAKAKGQNDVNQ